MKKFVLALPLLAAACSEPAPPPAPKSAPPPAVVVPPRPPAPTDWRDRPYTPGGWHYANHVATFGIEGARVLFAIQCDPGRRLVILSVAGNATTLTIRTSYAERNWPAQPGPDGRSVVSFLATDPQLDQIAFSRGRFSISAPDLPEIDIPAWAEPSRVIEDCRG